MPEPVFNESDRVSTPPGDSVLPAELVGKSPEEVAKHYQSREARLMENIRTQPAPVARTIDPPKTTTPSATDYWRDPAAATAQIIEQRTVSREEFERMNSATREASRLACEQMISTRYPDVMKRWPDQVKQLVGMLPAEQQVSPAMWEMVAVQVRGLHAPALEAEAELRGKQSMEPVAPPPPPTPKDISLTTEQKNIAARLGLSEDTFKKGLKNMEEGKWAQTLDNTKK